MRNIQKRYIYSAILASIFYIVAYVYFKMNIILAILLTFVIYAGGTFLFKKEDLRTLDSKNINKYYYLASKVQNEANKTEKDDIISTVENITNLTDAILVSLSQRPKKVEQAFQFFDYYLDILYKIIYKYNYIKAKETKSEADEEFIKSAFDCIKSINENFEKQHKNMQEAKIIDIENEIKIFEKNNGINQNNVEVGDNNGE